MRRTVIAVVATLALGAGLAGCGGQEAHDAVQGVRSDVQSRVDRARDDAVARARAEAGRAIDRARTEGARRLTAGARTRIAGLRARLDEALGGP